MQPVFPSQVTLQWPGHAASKTVQLEIHRGNLREGRIRVEGDNIAKGSGFIRDNLLELKIEKWVPGTTTATIFVPLGGITYEPKKLELCILSPFHQWRQYPNLPVPEKDSDEESLLHTTTFKDTIAAVVNRSGKRVLWLSGPPGSGKSFLLHHHLIPLFGASRTYKVISRPRERWEIFEKTSASPKLKCEYRFDPTMQWHLPSHLAAFYDSTGTGALLIDEAYDTGAMPDFVFELVLTVSQSESFYLDDFLLVIVDVLPVKRRLEKIKNVDQEAYRFLAPRIASALDDNSIQNVQLAPPDSAQIMEFMTTITRSPSITYLQVKQLLEMTGGNRYLLACVLDNWQSIYLGTRHFGRVSIPAQLSVAGQQLFDRLCQSRAFTPGKAAEFIRLRKEQKGDSWITSSVHLDSKWNDWVEGGVVLKQANGGYGSRYFIPVAFRDVHYKGNEED